MFWGALRGVPAEGVTEKGVGLLAGALRRQGDLPLQLFIRMELVSTGRLASSSQEVHMDTLRHAAFQDETVVLDGKHFIDCTLQNCTLEYSGGPVILERTHLRGCQYVFFGQAQSTVRLLQEVRLMPFEPLNWVEMSDHVH